ncbi:MAG: DMT family transporter [Opitutus sp.]|nr:DMT family transporter [Opitutus sp.]
MGIRSGKADDAVPHSGSSAARGQVFRRVLCRGRGGAIQVLKVLPPSFSFLVIFLFRQGFREERKFTRRRRRQRRPGITRTRNENDFWLPLKPDLRPGHGAWRDYGRGPEVVGHATPFPMSPPHSAERTRALLMLLLANFFWGLSFPLIKAIVLLHGRLLPEAGTWFLTVYSVAPRFVLATAILAVLGRGCWRATPREWQQGVIIGLFASAGMLFQNDGLQFTAASTSAFLTQFYAILIPVWLAMRSRQNPGLLVWTCCALVLVGVALLGRFDPFDQLTASGRELRFGRGEWETLLSSLFFMGQILTLGRKDYATNRPGQITFVMIATQALVFVVLAGFTTPNFHALSTPLTSPAWLGLTTILTVFCTLGAFSLMIAWQPKITTTEAGLIYCVEPIFGSAMALFLPAWLSVWAGIDYANETATRALLVGGGLITLANVLLQFSPPAKE